MTNFGTGERIIAATIQSGKGPKDAEEARVISLHLYTNRGRSLVAQAANCLPLGEKKHSRDGVVYTDVVIKCYDTPLKDGNVKGLWGRSDDTGIWRLGLIWGDLNKVCRVGRPLQYAAYTSIRFKKAMPKARQALLILLLQLAREWPWRSKTFKRSQPSIPS